MLRLRFHSDREREVLLDCECDVERRMLLGTSRSNEPRELPGSSLRGRLYENVGWQLLQQPVPQPRWKILRYPRATLSPGRVPRSLRRVRPDAAGDGLRTWRGAKSCGRMRGGTACRGLPDGPGAEPSRRMRVCAAANAGLPGRTGAEPRRQVRAERTAASYARPQGAWRPGRTSSPRRPENARCGDSTSASSGFPRPIRRSPRLLPAVGLSRP